MGKKKDIALESIYNKGRRVWPLVNADNEKVNCGPGQTIEMTKEKADKMVDGYPQEFIQSSKLVKGASSTDVKKLKKDIEELTTKNEDSTKQVEDLTTENVDLKKQVEDLTKTIEDLTAPVKEAK